MSMKRLTEKITDIYVSALLLVYPLWTGLSGYADITRAKWLCYCALTALWALALAAAVIARRERPRADRAFAAALTALLLWAVLSFVLSGSGVGAMGYFYDGLLPLALYVLTALGVMAYGVMKKRYVYLMAISSALCCALAVPQLMGFNPLGLYPEGYNYYGAGLYYSGAFLGTMGNTNILGAYLAVSAALVGSAAVKYGGRDLLLLIPAAFAALIILLAKSEAGLVGIGAAALIGIPYYVNKRNKKAGWLALLAELALCLAALAVIYFYEPPGGTLYELHCVLHGDIQDSFGSSRVAIWREALRVFSESPVTGGGPGSFGALSTLDFERFVEESGLTLRTHADSAHSDLLSCLAALGAPGALLAAAAAAVPLRRGLPGPAALALTAYLAQGLFSTGSVFTLPIAAALAALALGGDAKIPPGK